MITSNQRRATVCSSEKLLSQPDCQKTVSAFTQQTDLHDVIYLINFEVQIFYAHYTSIILTGQLLHREIENVMVNMLPLLDLMPAQPI